MLLVDARKLPFPDGYFDFICDSHLCYLPESDLDTAIRELFRECRVGVFYGGVTGGMNLRPLEGYDALHKAGSLFTPFEW